MATEIEYKFLVTSDAWRQQVKQSRKMTQGYLTDQAAGNTIRVRIADDQAYLTIKHELNTYVRQEFEYEIPLSDAHEMIRFCPDPVIDKIRYLVDYDGHTWEIDEFFGLNEGLIVAEVELTAVDEIFEKPDWLGQDVTQEKRYRNAALVKLPYTQWDDKV